MVRQQFGGTWTIIKLDILSQYLRAYTTALKGQPFAKIYIDAFAGSGSIYIGDDDTPTKGSAVLALEAGNPFDRYMFIERNRKNADQLKAMIHTEYSSLVDRTVVYEADCNTQLLDICQHTNWVQNRALLFLDPYAMSVQWDTLEAVAKTKAIDVWYLFPFSAATRLMKNDGNIDQTWSDKLDTVFGEHGWYDEFYREHPQKSLFDDEPRYYKDINQDALSDYIISRLNTLFPAVAPNPRVLFNTKTAPLFLFCFAVSSDNLKAQKLAMRIANHILCRK